MNPRDRVILFHHLCLADTSFDGKRANYSSQQYAENDITMVNLRNKENPFIIWLLCCKINITIQLENVWFLWTSHCLLRMSDKNKRGNENFCKVLDSWGKNCQLLMVLPKLWWWQSTENSKMPNLLNTPRLLFSGYAQKAIGRIWFYGFEDCIRIYSFKPA